METFNRRAITLLSSSIVSARFTDTSKGPPVKGATVIQTRPPPKESLWLRGVAVDGGAVAAKGQLLTTPLLPAAAVVFSWPPAVAVSSARVSRSGNMASALFPGSSLYLSLPKPLIPQACCCCCCLRCRTETEERAGRGGGGKVPNIWVIDCRHTTAGPITQPRHSSTTTTTITTTGILFTSVYPSQ